MLSKYVTHDYRLDELKDRQTHVLITQTIDRDGYHTGYEGLTYDPDCSRKHADRVDFHRELENQPSFVSGVKKRAPLMYLPGSGFPPLGKAIYNMLAGGLRYYFQLACPGRQ